jgi:hypothetical protein
MTVRANKEIMMPDDRFIAVAPPARSEGVGRALQIAFRDGHQLPPELQACVNKLDRIRF